MTDADVPTSLTVTARWVPKRRLVEVTCVTRQLHLPHPTLAEVRAPKVRPNSSLKKTMHYQVPTILAAAQTATNSAPQSRLGLKRASVGKERFLRASPASPGRHRVATGTAPPQLRRDRRLPATVQLVPGPRQFTRPQFQRHLLASTPNELSRQGRAALG
ncbi:hypothetical protein MRX96_056622 [Rhipicephalus microplus]